MHELSITENILQIVQRHAEKAGARRVLCITLVVGDLSSIVDDSVQFYFDYLSQNTVAAEATLEFKRLPVTLACNACRHQWQPAEGDWTCPACGKVESRLVAGREFYVDSIEVE